jgi:hypothetical protein
MVPLPDLLKYVGRHSSRRPESLSGRKFLINKANFVICQPCRSSGNTRSAPGSFQQARSLHPDFHHSRQPDRNRMQKAEYIPPALSAPASAAVE